MIDVDQCLKVIGDDKSKSNEFDKVYEPMKNKSSFIENSFEKVRLRKKKTFSRQTSDASSNIITMKSFPSFNRFSDDFNNNFVDVFELKNQ